MTPIPFLASPLKGEKGIFFRGAKVAISLPFRGRERVGVGLSRCLFNYGPISYLGFSTYL
jgi:hypothetical protein